MLLLDEDSIMHNLFGYLATNLLGVHSLQEKCGKATEQLDMNWLSFEPYRILRQK